MSERQNGQKFFTKISGFFDDFWYNLYKEVISINYLSAAFECLIIIYISKAYTQHKLNNKNKILLGIIVLADTLAIDFLIHDQLLAMTLFGQFVFLIMCSLYEKTIEQKLLLFFITNITCIILELISAIGVSIINLFVNNYRILEFSGNFITLILAFVLIFTPAHKIYETITTTRFSYKIALIYSYFIIISIIIITKMNLQFLYRYIYIYIIFIAFLIMCNFILLYYERVLLKKEHEIQSYHKNQPIYEELIKEIRSSQHEFSNRLQTLQVVCESTDNLDDIRDKLIEYTSKYSKPSHYYPLLSINMPLLAAALYSLASKADDDNINIVFDIGSHTLKSTISEVLLTDLACILLQNAIEASSSGDNIYVSIKSNGERTEIDVRNPVPYHFANEEISNFFLYGYSTKNIDNSTSHGMGLYYLKKELDKNHGEIVVDCIDYDDKNRIIFKMTI